VHYRSPNFLNSKHLIVLHVTSFHAHFVTQNTKNTTYSDVTSISLIL